MRSVFLPLTIAVAFWIFALQTAQAENAAEVIAQAAQAMAPPIQYDQIVEGQRRSVSISTSDTGALLTRIEFKGEFPMISISNEELLYYVFPRAKTSIDVSSLGVAAYEQARANYTTSGDSTASPFLFSKVLAFEQQVELNGKKCYKIRKTLSPESIKTILQQAPVEAVDNVTTEEVLFIEMNSYKLIRIDRYNNSRFLIGTEIRENIQPNAVLGMDVFLPPDGFETIAVETKADLYSRIKGLSTVRTAVPLGKIHYDKQSGLAVAPVPDGMDEADFRNRVEVQKRELVNASLPKLHSPKSLPGRAIQPMRFLLIASPFLLFVLYHLLIRFIPIIRKTKL